MSKIARPRRIRTKLEAGERAYGIAVQLPNPDLLEIAGQVGYDYSWIDAEHGAFGLSEIRELIRAADAVGMDSIVRVPDHNASFIQRVLDLGATGIMAPHVRSAAEARALVAASHYGPTGARGACPSIRSAGHISTAWPEDSRRSDDDVLVFGLIEDVEALNHVEEIANESGLDGLLFGPFDLSMAMGLEGDVHHDQLRAPHQRVLAACKSANIEYVVSAPDWEPGGVDEKSRIVTLVGDRGLIYTATLSALNEAMGVETKVQAF